MGELEKARFRIEKSYEWAGDDTDGQSLKKWSEGVTELFRQVDENVKPKWKRSNKPVQATSAEAAAPDL